MNVSCYIYNTLSGYFRFTFGIRQRQLIYVSAVQRDGVCLFELNNYNAVISAFAFFNSSVFFQNSLAVFVYIIDYCKPCFAVRRIKISACYGMQIKGEFFRFSSDKTDFR